MNRSTERILTTHAGSLPRPADLLEMNYARARGETVNADRYAGRLRQAVDEVVRRQTEVGLDVPDDGEFDNPRRFLGG